MSLYKYGKSPRSERGLEAAIKKTREQIWRERDRKEKDRKVWEDHDRRVDTERNTPIGHR
jgi:hypothetical protein